MRSFLVLMVLILFIILSLPLYLITLIIGLFSRHARSVVSQKIVNFAFRMVFLVAGTHMTVIGKENIPDVPVLFAGNHRSYADIPMAYLSSPHLIGFIAKKQLGKVPGLNWWMHNVNCLFLDRKDLKKGFKTILKAIDYVKQGYSMFVMPEGTRNHSDELLPFKEGSFKISEKTGCPIVPVAITGSDDIYELHSPHIRKAKVIIHYGKPIYTAELPKEERKFIGNQVRDIIISMLKEDAKVYNSGK